MMVAKSIQAKADRIVREFHPVRLILFGSHARGDAGLQSDIDLLVVLPQVSDKRRAAVEIRRALANFPVCKDIIVTTPEEIARRGDFVGPVLRPTLREGKVLIEIPPKCAGSRRDTRAPKLALPAPYKLSRYLTSVRTPKPVPPLGMYELSLSGTSAAAA